VSGAAIVAIDAIPSVRCDDVTSEILLNIRYYNVHYPNDISLSPLRSELSDEKGLVFAVRLVL